jgi:hypothetical protein
MERPDYSALCREQSSVTWKIYRVSGNLTRHGPRSVVPSPNPPRIHSLRRDADGWRTEICQERSLISSRRPALQPSACGEARDTVVRRHSAERGCFDAKAILGEPSAHRPGRRREGDGRRPHALVRGTTSALKADLIALLGKDRVLHRSIDLVRYASDASPIGLRPKLSCFPTLVLAVTSRAIRFFASLAADFWRRD